MSMNMQCVRDGLVRRGCTDHSKGVGGGGVGGQPGQLTCGENGCLDAEMAVPSAGLIDNYQRSLRNLS